MCIRCGFLSIDINQPFASSLDYQSKPTKKSLQHNLFSSDHKQKNIWNQSEEKATSRLLGKIVAKAISHRLLNKPPIPCKYQVNLRDTSAF